MKNKSFLAILLVFLGKICLGQNHIANGGFELRENSASSDKPNDAGDAQFIEGWKSEIHCEDGPNVITGQSEDCGLQLHSPDWWSVEEGDYDFDGLKFPFRVPDYVSGNWQIANPKEGEKFVGMGYGELIQQDLYSGNHLTPGRTYYLSFYVQLFTDGQYMPTITSSYQNTSIKAFIAANRIKYANNDPFEYESSSYVDKVDGISQNIDLIGSQEINLTDFPLGVWHIVSFEFEAPNDYVLNDMDWVAIELDYGGGPGTYIGVDDVTLMECPPTESCSPTYGQIWPNFSGSHTATEPWRIDNISNAKRLELEIWPMNGGNITQLAVECELGFPNGWEWSGQNAQGAEFANGNYVYELRAMNQCGTARFTGNFAKINASNNPTDVSELFFGCGGVTYVPPKQCCEHEPVMYIDDHHWINEEFTLHASSELIVASNAPVVVGQGSNVIMRAGERIELNPGFSSDNADYFLAEIVPCGYVPPPAQRLADPEGEPEDMQASMDSESKTNTDVEPDFSIYPNPNSGTFTISGSLLQKITITDTTGKLIKQLNGGLRSSLEVDGLSAGLYLVRAQMADGSVENAKVVVQ